MAHRNGEIPTSALTPLSVGGHLLSAPAAAFEEWRRQAAKAGRVLTITSAADAYRVLAVQERVFLQRYIPQATGGGIYGDIRWYRNVRYVRRHGAAAAVPGTSNHGRGLAVDVKNAGPFGGAFHDWMLTTGPALGWSNTEGRSVGEPWHWVHDGATLASSATDTAVGLAPGKPITQPAITLPEDTMSAETERQIKALYDAVFNGGESLPAGLPTPVRAEQIAETAPGLTATAVWSTPIQRGGKPVAALQELADAKTAALAASTAARDALAEVRDMRAQQANEIWLAPVLGVEPTTGKHVIKRAADWLTGTAFRADSLSATAIAQAIPADIAREVADLLAKRLKG